MAFVIVPSRNGARLTVVSKNQGGDPTVVLWARAQRRRGVMESSIETRCAQVVRVGKDLDLTTVSAEDIETWLDGRRISNRTRYTYLSTLGSFYTWGVDYGHFAKDPTHLIHRPRLRQSLPRPILDADLAVALAGAPPVMGAWLELMAFAGLRCSEVAKLDRGSVLDRADPMVLRVFGKGEKERLIPLRARVLSALRRTDMPRHGLLFRNEADNPYTAARLSRLVALYFDGLGIDATAHQLRHWFATKAYAVSSDLRVVQELLGHSSPTTTAIYTQWSSARAIEAVNSIEVTA